MTSIQKHIIGQSVQQVTYSEVNHHDGQFYHDGFDTFDHAINVQMTNGFWWHLAWKNEEYFELGMGLFEQNELLDPAMIKSWEATHRWQAVLNTPITNFEIAYIDEAKFIPYQIKIDFKNGKQMVLMITHELNLDRELIYPLEYAFNGEIYVFHDIELINKLKLNS